MDKFLDAQAKSDESASAEYNAILMLPDVDLMQVRIVASVFGMCLRRIVFFFLFCRNSMFRIQNLRKQRQC